MHQWVNSDWMNRDVLKKEGGALPMPFQVALQPVKVVGMGFPEITPERVGPNNEMIFPNIEGIK